MLQGMILVWSLNKLVLFNINCMLWVFFSSLQWILRFPEIDYTTVILTLPGNTVTYNEKFTEDRKQYTCLTVINSGSGTCRCFLGSVQVILTCECKAQIMQLSYWRIQFDSRWRDNTKRVESEISQVCLCH